MRDAGSQHGHWRRGEGLGHFLPLLDTKIFRVEELWIPLPFYTLVKFPLMRSKWAPHPAPSLMTIPPLLCYLLRGQGPEGELELPWEHLLPAWPSLLLPYTETHLVLGNPEQEAALRVWR